MKLIPPVFVELSAVLSAVADLKSMAEEIISKDIVVLLVASASLEVDDLRLAFLTSKTSIV